MIWFWYPKTIPEVSCYLFRDVHDRLKTRDGTKFWYASGFNMCAMWKGLREGKRE